VRGSRISLGILGAAAVTFAVVVAALYTNQPTPSLGTEQPDTFTLATAILVVALRKDV
jgi:hypothetical protein